MTTAPMTMPSPDLTQFSLAGLLDYQESAAARLASAKARVAEGAAELGRRYAAAGRQALDQAGKSHGTMTLLLQDGFSIKVDVKQTVDWDSDALQSIARQLPWQRTIELFKIKFTMSETIYKGISVASPQLREKVDAARTTRIGEPVITLVKDA